MTEIDKPHSKYPHAYAVVRVDLPMDDIDPGSQLAVPKVFVTRVAAEQEAERLSRINGEKSCKYLVCITHLVV